MFADLPMLNAASPTYCPSVPSPFPDYTQSQHQLYNFPSYDFFSVMGQSAPDRQMSSYSQSPASLLSCKPASPDVISLD